jgi:ribosome-associated translation inhibitor RaiA
MNPNDAVRARVTAHLQDIEHAQRELGLSECDRGDLEVHRIIARIERKLAKAKPKLNGRAAE